MIPEPVMYVLTCVFGPVLLIALCGVLWPKTVWYLQFGWRFKGAEPSKAVLLAIRVQGFLMATVAVLVFIGLNNFSLLLHAVERVAPGFLQRLGEVEKTGDSTVLKPIFTAWYTLVLSIAIVNGLLSIVAPRLIWRLEIGSWLKNAQPSDAAMRSMRIGGLIELLIGLCVLGWIYPEMTAAPTEPSSIEPPPLEFPVPDSIAKIFLLFGFLGILSALWAIFWPRKTLSFRHLEGAQSPRSAVWMTRIGGILSVFFIIVWLGLVPSGIPLCGWGMPLLILSIFLFNGVYAAVWPRAHWQLNRGWRFKNVEPSGISLFLTRLGGIVTLVIGGIIVLAFIGLILGTSRDGAPPEWLIQMVTPATPAARPMHPPVQPTPSIAYRWSLEVTQDALSVPGIRTGDYVEYRLRKAPFVLRIQASPPITIRLNVLDRPDNFTRVNPGSLADSPDSCASALHPFCSYVAMTYVESPFNQCGCLIIAEMPGEGHHALEYNAPDDHDWSRVEVTGDVAVFERNISSLHYQANGIIAPIQQFAGDRLYLIFLAKYRPGSLISEDELRKVVLVLE